MKKLNKYYIVKTTEGRYITPYGFSGVVSANEAVKFYTKEEALKHIRKYVGYGHYIIEERYEVYNGT